MSITLDELKQQQAFIAAAYRRATQSGTGIDAILGAVQCGWLYFDGAEMREPGFVAIMPDGEVKQLTLDET